MALASSEHPPQSAPTRARLFISYKRDCDPDESVATQVFQELKHHHDVFIDQTMPVGTRWAERIESELRQADYLITFLSAQSVHSEMVQGEIETAYHLAKENQGRPKILPVRLNFREPFQYPLSAYLNPINWAQWSGPGDTPKLVVELLGAIQGHAPGSAEPDAQAGLPAAEGELPRPLPSAQPIPLASPEGTVDLRSDFYVRRASDDIALGALAQDGFTVVIKGPRQMGKSSLLFRVIDAATTMKKSVAFLDFQLFTRSALTDGDRFFQQFCSLLSDSLELEDKVGEYWALPLGNSQRCTRYISRHILRRMDGPLVLAMDEVDNLFEADFRSDFFGMLRAWHNERAIKPEWKRVNLALVTSTEPYQFINSLNQSPFNVGEVIELGDFTPAQVAELNQRHGSPLDRSEESRLQELLGGHPYLVRRALYLVASRRLTASELFSTAAEDGGPFGDHLRYHLFRLNNSKDLTEGLSQVINGNRRPDPEVFFRLKGAGLVRDGSGRKAVPRCQLYADYFREHLYV